MKWAIIILSIFQLSSVNCIICYLCDSANNFTCTELWDPNLPVTQKFKVDCNQIVSEAKYCIKMTGIFEGKLGTKRFCSSKTWGDYCEYIARPGDIQEYRSCVYSCNTNECNNSPPQFTKLSSFINYLIPTLITCYFLFRY